MLGPVRCFRIRAILSRISSFAEGTERSLSISPDLFQYDPHLILPRMELVFRACHLRACQSSIRCLFGEHSFDFVVLEHTSAALTGHLLGEEMTREPEYET